MKRTSIIALATAGTAVRASSRAAEACFCHFSNSYATSKSPFPLYKFNHPSRLRISSVAQSSLDGKTTTSEQDRLFPEELNIIYDSKCSVCKLEIDFLARRDIKLSGFSTRKLKMTDLEDEVYNPGDPANGGVSYAKGMAAIHAVTADGRVIEGVPVFSSAYQLVGLGWLFKFTEWPVIKTVVRWGYVAFARYRTNVTRGSSLEDLVEAYEAKQGLENAKNEIEDCKSCSTNDAVRK
jgi:predicted DCC family thiol-disulfide oxidoreductase YuxK